MRICISVGIWVWTVAPAVAGIPYNQDFEAGTPGQLPLVGAGTWDAVTQGAGCTNKIVSAAASPFGEGQAVRLTDSSDTAGTLLLENDDLGDLARAHLSFRLYDAGDGPGTLRLVVGRDSDSAALAFVRLEIGAGVLTAVAASGENSLTAAYPPRSSVRIDVIANSGATGLGYSTANGLTGVLGADRYDVYVNGILVIDEADPAAMNGSFNALAFSTDATAVGVDVYLDSISLRMPTSTADPPDFTLLATPLAAETAVGASATYELTVAPSNGFASPVMLTASGLPAGSTATFSGNPVGPGNWSAQLTAGVPTGTPTGTYVFRVQGTDGEKTRERSLSLTVVDRVTLTASVVGGNGTVAPTTLTCDRGTVVAVTASPNTGYRVKAWTGTDNDSARTNTNTVTMTTDRTVTVEFEPIPPPTTYTLTVSVLGGHGAVTPTAGVYEEGTVVQITATPDSGHRVKAWTGTDNDSAGTNTNTVTMTTDRTVTVEFEPIPPPTTYTLTASVVGGHGSVSPTYGTYEKGVIVALTAVPDTGYRVQAWTGTDDDTAQTITNTVTMKGDTVVTVTFDTIPIPPGGGDGGDAGGGDAGGGGTAAPPTAPTNLTAVVSASRVELSWTDNSADEEGFEVERAASSTLSDAIWMPLARVVADTRRYIDVSVLPSTRYVFRLRAYRGATASPWIEIGPMTTPSGPPSMPANLQIISIGYDHLTLAWTDIDDELGFVVQRRVSGGDWIEVVRLPAGATTYTDTNVQPATAYGFRIAAYNAAGQSDWLTATTILTPGAPSPAPSPVPEETPPPPPAGGFCGAGIAECSLACLALSLRPRRRR